MCLTAVVLDFVELARNFVVAGLMPDEEAEPSDVRSISASVVPLRALILRRLSRSCEGLMGIVESDGAALSPRPMTPTVEPLRLDFCSDIVNRGSEESRGIGARNGSQDSWPREKVQADPVD